MSFNPDKNKHIQEVLFSRKTKSVTYLPVFLNKFDFKLESAQKHFLIESR